MATENKERTIPEMCAGCARDKQLFCEIIKNPNYFFAKYGVCFAKVDKARAKQIEHNIDFMTKAGRHYARI